MENNSVNTEVTKTEPVVIPDSKVERVEKTSSLRKSIEKNLKESDAPEEVGKTKDLDVKPVVGDQTTPAQNKSFVNGENQQVILAPKGMNEEERKAWGALTPEGKKFLARRGHETDTTFNRRMAELTQKEKEVGDLIGAVSPEIREEYTRQGIAIPDLVRRSIAWDKRVKEGIDGALEFLEAHGYKAEDLVNHKSEPVKPEYLTREDAEKIAEEKAQNLFKLQQQSSIAEQNANALYSFIDSKPIFKSDPGTAAQIENAVAEEVEYLQFKQFQGSTSQLLEKAYERAIANNPAFSSLMSSPQQAATQNSKPEDIHEQMERVRAAKAASKSASGSLGSGSPQYKSNSTRESLERNAAKFSS